MILPNLIVHSRIGTCAEFNSMDHPSHCLDRKHFSEYPYPVSYHFNSRGYRDYEWPSQLNQSVWCVGDSFTVGIGSAFEHTWPQVLSKTIDRSVVNVSMDGASNEWISRIAQEILEQIRPAHMVIMWSFAHRRESPNVTLTDERRRIHIGSTELVDNLNNFETCVQAVNAAAGSCIIQHTLVPHGIMHCGKNCASQAWTNIRGENWPATPDHLADLLAMHPAILAEINQYHSMQDLVDIFTVKDLLEKHKILPVEQIDLARDGFHFGVETSKLLVSSIQNFIS